MSKSTVAELLSKNPTKWFSARQIANLLELSISTCSTTMKRFREDGIRDVEYKLIKKSRPPYNIYLYRWKE